MIEPLYIATVGGHPLRFFKTPLDDGRPDFPWHAIDDLHRCLGLNRAQRKLLLSRMRSWKGGGEVRTVATADGITTVAPHFMALGVIDGLVEEGTVSAATSFEYDRASAAAAKKLVTPFAFPTDEWFDWMKAAMNRWA